MDFDVHKPEPHRTGHRWVDFCIAGSALAVSVISLVVAIGHGRTMEQMAQANARLVKANSWPFIGLHLSRDAHSVEIGIRNAGVGPAKIRWVEMTWKGQPVRSTGELLARCCGYLPGAHLDYSYEIATSSVVRPGEDIAMITLRDSGVDQGVFSKLRTSVTDILVSTCYCSVCDECYLSHGISLDTRAMKTCARPANAFDDKPRPPA